MSSFKVFQNQEKDGFYPGGPHLRGVGTIVTLFDDMVYVGPIGGGSIYKFSCLFWLLERPSGRSSTKTHKEGLLKANIGWRGPMCHIATNASCSLLPCTFGILSAFLMPPTPHLYASIPYLTNFPQTTNWMNYLLGDHNWLICPLFQIAAENKFTIKTSSKLSSLSEKFSDLTIFSSENRLC